MTVGLTLRTEIEINLTVEIGLPRSKLTVGRVADAESAVCDSMYVWFDFPHRYQCCSSKPEVTITLCASRWFEFDLKASACIIIVHIGIVLETVRDAPAYSSQITSLLNQMFGLILSIGTSVITKKLVQKLPHGQTAEAYVR